ncbi:MAG TPA: hypothetical protein ENJ40_00155 [Thermosulfurimonas dismutans]|uniref:Phage head morphogenesis domain-containing protein n=1 Tax=Thermosulfurimonas dismutans TaxID=999894 RepID=A0A7C3CJC9_9BACT|nr:hypothetical protein [Thermosulfurimonas dismutans]
MEYLKRYRRTKSLDGKKIPLSEWSTGRLWDLTYQVLATAFLMGMNHAGERLEMAGLAEIMPEPLPFEEAAAFFRARVPLTREEWDELEVKLRFRAFTVARLTELDAVNRIREKLLKVIEEGKTFQQFMAEAGEDELLRKAGFHRSNPWYWETVFRTNIQTAYNAGRRMQIMRAPDVLYLEFVGIRDSRQTEICRKRTGVIRPAGDPWWSRNWPPLHFNCRSTVRAIYREEAEARSVRVTPKRKLSGLGPTAEGFGLDPIEAGTFWRITPGMWSRAERYKIREEIEALARRIGIDSFVLGEAEIPRDMAALGRRLTEIKSAYGIASPRSVVIEKDPLARAEGMRGAGRWDTGQMWLSSEVYETLRGVLERGVIRTTEELRAFRTLVHEFGHLLGRPVTELYDVWRGYRYTVEVVNDYWAALETARLARRLGLRIEVPATIRTLRELSSYPVPLERARNLLKAAGFTEREIQELFVRLNLSVDTEEFIAEIERAMARKLGRNDLPADIYRQFGEALDPKDPNTYSNYLKRIKELRRSRLKEGS